MSGAIIVTGTDTNIGKTVFAAALTSALKGYYWKPVQAGLSGETDAQIVARLSGAAPDHILPEAFRLQLAASPHLAAERDGVAISAEQLAVPNVSGPLIIEGAGGLLVPLSRKLLQIDLFCAWKAPVILCASTRLGTINHTLLSVEALKQRGIAILGVAFMGDENSDSERTIAEIGGVRRLGRLPRLDPLDKVALDAAFVNNFKLADVLGLGAMGP